MKKIFIALVAIITLAACNKNEFISPVTNQGEIKLVLKADGFNQINTRAVTENLVNDITILQFKEGTLVKKLYYSGQDFVSKPLTITAGTLEAMPAATMKTVTDLDGNEKEILNENGSENVIYVLANLGSENATGLVANGDGTPVSTFDDFKKLSLDFAENGEVLPMNGYYYGGITAEVTDQINITLNKSVAKINFTLNTTNFKVGDETPSITVNSIKLINVPVKYSPYACFNRPGKPQNNEAGKWPEPQAPFPVVPSDDTQYDAAFMEYTAAQNNAADPSKEFVAYIPENVRGSYDSEITSQKAKHPSSLGVSNWTQNDQHGYTYILVDLDYAMKSGITKNATYKIFLGGDNKGDMNLLRGYSYNVTTNLYGANDADTRIEVSTVFDPKTGLQGDDAANIKGTANSYIINPTGSDINFVLPLTQVRFGWNAIKPMLAADHADKNLNIDEKIVARNANTSFEYEWLDYATGPAITFSEPDINFSEGNGTNNEGKYFIKVTIPSGVEAGHNAIIRFKDGKTTLWSWHLWITDYAPAATQNETKAGQVHTYYGNAFKSPNRYYGKVMMDRNLGATITDLTTNTPISQPTTNDDAEKYFGLYYQFGRKDPFATTGALPGDKIVSGPVTYAEATKNPSTFYKVDSGDWNNNGGANTDYWNSSVDSKSVFDPCPEGWRVPNGGTTATQNVWAGFGVAEASSTGSANNTTNFGWSGSINSANKTAGRLYTDDSGVKAWYPASGNRAVASGALVYVGSNRYYWSASPNNSTSGYTLTFSSSTVNPAHNSSRGNGFPVRCVRE